MMRIRASAAFLVVAVLTLLFAGAARSAPEILPADVAPESQAVSEESTPQQEVPVVDQNSESTPHQPEPQPADPPEQQGQPPAEHEQAPEPEPEPVPAQQ